MITLILFSKINIFNESTRYFSKITNKKSKKDFSDDKEARFFRNN